MAGVRGGRDDVLPTFELLPFQVNMKLKCFDRYWATFEGARLFFSCTSLKLAEAPPTNFRLAPDLGAADFRQRDFHSTILPLYRRVQAVVAPLCYDLRKKISLNLRFFCHRCIRANR